jgi:hypothetical protein
MNNKIGILIQIIKKIVNLYKRKEMIGKHVWE